jgi:hypothetical protein
MKSFIILVCLAGLFSGKTSFAQAPSSYALPENYRFDYEVSQNFTSKKNAADTCTIHFFYTKSGEYAAARFSGMEKMKGNMTMVITRDGYLSIFDDQHKRIIILSTHKLMADLMNLAKYIRVDSLMANMRGKMNGGGNGLQSTKTGNHKTIGGYTTEEFTASDSHGAKSTVWIAKVDFDTQVDYLLSALGGGGMLKMMGSSASSATHPLMQAIVQSRSLVTEVMSVDSAGRTFSLNATSISANPSSIAVSGYTVSNYSNMGFMEIMGAEMRRKNE